MRGFPSTERSHFPRPVSPSKLNFFGIRKCTTILQVPRFDLGLDCLLPKTNGSSTRDTGFSSVRTFNFTHFRNVQFAEQLHVNTCQMYVASIKRETLFFSCKITFISLRVKTFVILSRLTRSSCFRPIFLGALVCIAAFFTIFVTHYGRHFCSAFTLSVADFTILEAFHVFSEM